MLRRSCYWLLYYIIVFPVEILPLHGGTVYILVLFFVGMHYLPHVVGGTYVRGRYFDPVLLLWFYLPDLFYLLILLVLNCYQSLPQHLFCWSLHCNLHPLIMVPIVVLHPSLYLHVLSSFLPIVMICLNLLVLLNAALWVHLHILLLLFLLLWSVLPSHPIGRKCCPVAAVSWCASTGSVSLGMLFHLVIFCTTGMCCY